MEYLGSSHLNFCEEENGGITITYESYYKGEDFEANYILDQENADKLNNLLLNGSYHSLEVRIREEFFISGEEPLFCSRFCDYMSEHGIKYGQFTWY